MKTLGVLFICGSLVAVAGCGGGGGGDGGGVTTTTLTISGTVSAQGGMLAKAQPQGLQRLWAWVVGDSAVASLYGVGPAATTVKLYKINSAGVTDGDALATTTSLGDGSYSVSATGSASDLTVGTGLIVRAEGTTESLTAIVSSTTTNIDPVSDATFKLLKDNVGDLTKISLAELTALQQEVAVYANQVDFAAATTNAGLTTAIANEFKNSVTASFMLANGAAGEQVCGTVTDAGSAALAGIVIEARDFNDNDIRNKTMTGSDGKYCMNVAPGDYVLSARNDTASSYAASEWYNAAGGAAVSTGADKVVIAAGDAKTIDFQLASGGRIAGIVKAGVSATADSRTWNQDDPLPDLQIFVRRYDDYALAATTRSGADGNFYVNVAPGDYFVMVRNTTRQPYAGEVYDGINGRAIWQFAARVTVIADNATPPTNFPLAEGHSITGVVKKNDGSAAAGQRIRIDYVNGGSVDRIDARVDGTYRIWLRSANEYTLYSRGQTAAADLTTGSKDNVDFTDQVAEYTLKLVEAADTTKPVPDAKLTLRDTSWNLVSQEPSRGDGTVTLYSPNYNAGDSTADDYYLEIKFDDGRYLASQIYNGKTSKAAGDVLTIARNELTHDIGTVQIAAGGALKGKVVFSDGTTPAGNRDVRLYAGDTTNQYRFVLTLTNGDGTFSLSLPPGDNTLYKKLRMADTWSDTCPGCDEIFLTNTSDVYTPEINITSGADFTFGDNTASHVINLSIAPP